MRTKRQTIASRSRRSRVQMIWRSVRPAEVGAVASPWKPATSCSATMGRDYPSGTGFGTSPCPRTGWANLAARRKSTPGSGSTRANHAIFPTTRALLFRFMPLRLGSPHVSGDRRFAVSSWSRGPQLGLRGPPRQRRIGLPHKVHGRIRRYQAAGFIDGGDGPSGGGGDVRGLVLGKEPTSRSGDDREQHDAGSGGGGRHAAPPHQADRPGLPRTANGPIADLLPGGGRWRAAVHPLAKRAPQVHDQLAVDAHFATAVGTGLQVLQVRPG